MERPGTGEVRRGDLLAYRRFALLAAIATPLFGVLHRATYPAAVDSMATRLALSALCGLIALLTYTYPRRPLVLLIYATLYLYTAWALHLLVSNGLYPDYAVGMLAVIGAVSVGFLEHVPLRWYLMITLATTAVALVMVPPAPDTNISAEILLGYLFLFSVLAYLTLRGRLVIQAKLAASRARYALAAEGANDGLWDWDLVTNQVFFSPRWKRMLGLAEAEVGSAPEEWLDRLHPDDAPRMRRELDRHLAGESEHFESEFRIRHRDGDYLWMLARGLAQRTEDGQAVRVAGSQTDITARKRAEEQLLHDALHDALTGLPNRALFRDRLRQVFNRRHRHPERRFAVLFIDLDRFKVINDSLGHQVGDELLGVVAQRLQRCVRPEDTVARLGGDEFAMVLADIPGAGELSRIATRIQAEVAAPIELGEREVITSASIGIALGPGAYDREDDMLRDADLAMYRAKAQGPGHCTLFDEEMHARSLAVLELETGLRRAIERDELRVHYQPIVALEPRRITGFEALVRWEHPTRGLLSPMEFIPLAEETGQIHALGRKVLEVACRQMREWQQRFPERKWTVSVNVSGRQLTHPGFVADVDAVLRSTGLSATALRLEITESVLLSDPEAAIRVLAELRGLGVQLHLDDFGTGYSSLSYLHRFPIDAVKIDRSFVRGMDSNSRNAAIVRSLVVLARTLGVSVVAEGVETAAELGQLLGVDCAAGQGFLFAPPLEPHAAAALLQGETAALEALGELAPPRR